MSRSQGRSVAVMAATQGLGRAAAEAFAREGARVFICGRDEAKLKEAVSAINAAAARDSVSGIVADVTRVEDVQRFIDGAVKWGEGRLDVLVTNSGGPPPGRFGDVSERAWRDSFDLIVLSVVRAVTAALPHLRKSRGSVVSIISTSVKQPIPGLVLSNSLRMAVVGLVKSLANEEGPNGVRFNAVLPGSFETERIYELLKFQAKEAGVEVEALKAKRVGEVPLGRYGRPKELAQAILFLASEDASYITGSALAVDGGVVRFPYG